MSTSCFSRCDDVCVIEEPLNEDTVDQVPWAGCTIQLPQPANVKETVSHPIFRLMRLLLGRAFFVNQDVLLKSLFGIVHFVTIKAEVTGFCAPVKTHRTRPT